jgi:cytoskeletal protein RodZ
MRLAGGQLALQSHILSGGKVDTQTLAKIFADGVVTEKEEETLGKYLTQPEIERIKKRLSKEKIQKISKKFSISFFSYLKNLLTKSGFKIFVALIAIIFIAGLIFVLPKIIKGVPNIFSGKNSPAQTSVQPPAETAPVIVPEGQPSLESSASLTTTTLELTTSDSEQKSISNLEKPIFILIKETPIGWLNVRKEPSKTAEIIAKVNSGERLETIGLEEAKGAEKFGWYNIILPDAKTGSEGEQVSYEAGWVYEEYVQISVE